MIDTKNISAKYRPIPFWSWNDKLTVEETKFQVNEMHNVGIGGFFMHARGGLQTEYMGEEWFENVEAATAEGERLGMRPWAYDENGWPSGFGSGRVNGLGLEYQQKYLRMEENLEHTEHQICKSGDHYFYFEVNPFYVDTLDAKVIKEFIESTYVPYYERFGNRIEGFFTDEPQISRNGIPWSFVFEEEYQKRYNENLLEHLEELFLPVGDYAATRIKFWKMVTELFSENFMKQIHDWCEEHGMKLTGHLVQEDTMLSQLVSNGACMAHYEYFHIPGMDWLCRDIVDCLIPRQVSSVAEQMGQDQVLSETFALSGHNVSLEELKGIYEWQMVRGINWLCPHLEGYTNRGLRKRDYPPAMYMQQPWWSEYGKWVDAMSRIGKVLHDGGKKADILVLHPQTTAWALYDDGENKGIRELNSQFLAVNRALEEKHVNFHFGDETMMERHGKVENGKLIIGKQAYSCIVDPGCEHLLPNTKRLLDEFKAQDGQIVTPAEIPANPIMEECAITYVDRTFEGYKAHYFVNTSAEAKTVKINVAGKKMDIYTGELEAFAGVHRFEPWGSLMIFEEDCQVGGCCEAGRCCGAGVPCDTCEAAEQSAQADAAVLPEVTLCHLDGKFTVAEGTLNTMTLDRCDYYFDGELQEEKGYILNVCERANALERPVHIKMDFRVKAEVVPEVLYLVTESPEQFTITINGQEIEKNVEGYFRDKSFMKIDVSKYFAVGENVITYNCDFEQSPEFYENLRKSWVFESEKNKLAYDMEIESIYLLGTFGVKTEGEWTALDRNAYRYHGEFVITEQAKEISLSNIEQQGFPFFCGELTVAGELEVQGEHPVLELDLKGVNALRAEIGSLRKTVLTDDRLSLEGLTPGKYPVKLTLINNLRNLLGPHHLKVGESYAVGPGSFFKERCVWNFHPEKQWDDDYCFVKFGR